MIDKSIIYISDPDQDFGPLVVAGSWESPEK